MKRRHLISTYTKIKFKPMKTISNEAKLKRQFSNCQPLEAIVTGLTYVRVEAK